MEQPAPGHCDCTDARIGKAGERVEKRVRTPREKRRRTVWLILLFIFVSSVVSTLSTAWQVKQAILCRDPVRLPSSWKDLPGLQDEVSKYYEIIWYEPEQYDQDIATSFSSGRYCHSPDKMIEAKVVPLATVFGLGEKWVFLIYSRRVFNAQGETCSGAWDIPVILRFKWKPFHWELYSRWESI